MKASQVQGIIVLLILLSAGNSFCQDININSVSTAREQSGDGGYTLDGAYMTYSRAKLLNPQYFGPAGIYPHTVQITDGYAGPGSLTQVTTVPVNELFFFGAFNKVDPRLYQFSSAEIDSLYAWSIRGGKLIIAASAAYQSGYDPSVLNSKWGFSIVLQVPSVCNPTAEGNNTVIYNGPFGRVTSAAQGGGAQGYFNVIPPGAIVLARNVNDSATLILDCKTLDLIVADVDAYTSVGLISQGSQIVGGQDKFWANTIVFMDQLESPPVITSNNGYSLSTSAYQAYQWYLNDTAIAGANSEEYVPQQNGSYKVQVTLKCGCEMMSDTVMFEYAHGRYVVPNAFTPNGDGKNDVLFVLGNGIDNMTFTIYDRWGEKVFESHNINNGWDGTFKGKPMPTQTLVYYLEGTYASGEHFKSKGCITLLR